MHPAVRYVVLWLAICALVTVVLVLTSDGEPVCDGPLVYDTDDSDPPQCNSLLDGLRRMMPVIAVGAFGLTWLAAAGEWLLGRVQRRGIA